MVNEIRRYSKEEIGKSKNILIKRTLVLFIFFMLIFIFAQNAAGLCMSVCKNIYNPSTCQCNTCASSCNPIPSGWVSGGYGCCILGTSSGASKICGFTCCGCEYNSVCYSNGATCGSVDCSSYNTDCRTYSAKSRICSSGSCTAQACTTFTALTSNSCNSGAGFCNSAGDCVNLPVTTISPNSAAWTNQNVTFNISCLDAVYCSQIQYAIINKTEQCVSASLTTFNGINLWGNVTCNENSSCEKKVCYKSIFTLPYSDIMKESNVFKIDKIKPWINDSYSPSKPIVNEKINITSYANDSESGIKNITIYIDGNPSFNCSKNSCNVSMIYGEVSIGKHTYYARAYDYAGNFNDSIIKQFIVNGNPAATCLVNTNNNGTLCAVGEYCIGGMFVDSSDGGSGTSALCCFGGTCNSQYVLLLCGPPNGIEYNPLVASCASDIDAQVEDASLRCCSGTPSLIDSNTFEVYWSRQTSGYFKLTEAAEGDYLYCVAKGVSGNVHFDIQKPGGLSSGDYPASNGMAMLKVTADEVGKMRCTVNLNSTEITVTETGKNENALPFFGIIQFIIALTAIIMYCRVKVKS